MFKIGNKIIGDGQNTFIIAEAGVNHNGRADLAKKLVDEALKAGADAIKFQTFRTENLVTGYANMAKYQKENTGVSDSQFNMLKRLELGFDDFADINRYCREKGIIFMSTPFDFESADFLNSIGMDVFKISSGDLTNIPLLEHIASFKKPVILSSGMATLGEIEDALGCIFSAGAKDAAVLHCTSNYPASLETVNLRAMLTIKNAFRVPGGYSDHTEGITVSIAAAALGADIIEKHFTLDKKMEGPDHRASLEPSELREMVEAVRQVEASLGSGIKMFNQSEKDTMRAARKSIVASRNIKAGEIIAMEDLDFKRPGNGVMPKFYRDFIGKRARMDIGRDEQIDFNAVE